MSVPQWAGRHGQPVPWRGKCNEESGIPRRGLGCYEIIYWKQGRFCCGLHKVSPPLPGGCPHGEEKGRGWCVAAYAPVKQMRLSQPDAKRGTGLATAPRQNEDRKKKQQNKTKAV